jgi:NADH-quinone oxidoreductase subunit N
VAVFKAAISGDLTWLAVIMAVNVVIGLYYYLRWAAALFGMGPAAAASDGATARAGGAADAGVGVSADAGTADAATLPRFGTRRIPLAPRVAIGLALALAVFLSVYPTPAFDAITR